MGYRSSGIWVHTCSEGKSLRSLMFGIIGLVLACMFLIGGCNNSGSNQVDGRTIGEINGVVVPALEAELFLIAWEEDAPDGHLYLNGSRVATLSTAEEQAIRDAYQMGFIVALINPDIDDMLDLHEVLGHNPIFGDNGTVDLFAISREFNVSGIRYFTLHPVQNDDGDPIEPEQNRNRVIALIEWTSDTAPASVQRGEGTTPTNELTKLADSLTFTHVLNLTPPDEAKYAPLKPDFRAQITFTTTALSAHSILNDVDFYYLQTNYQLTPTSTLGDGLFSVCSSLCDVGIINLCNDQFSGVQFYEPNSGTQTFTSTSLTNIINSPPTTVDEETTTSSISHTIGGSASFSQDDGAGVGVSESVTYDKSQSYSSPTVVTTNLNNTGVLKNNGLWKFSIGGSRVRTSNFTPEVGWIWEGQPSTRVNGFIVLTQDVNWDYYPFSCTEWVVFNALLEIIVHIPVPPLPPN